MLVAAFVARELGALCMIGNGAYTFISSREKILPRLGEVYLIMHCFLVFFFLIFKYFLSQKQQF